MGTLLTFTLSTVKQCLGRVGWVDFFFLEGIFFRELSALDMPLNMVK